MTTRTSTSPDTTADTTADPAADLVAPVTGLPPGNPANPGQLTDRELQVMTMIGRGHSNAEIAEELYLSVNTIKTHVRNAYRRVGLRRRVDAVIWTMRHVGVAPVVVAPVAVTPTEPAPA